MHNKNERIQYLDGLRGLAIVLVMLFHAYARWPALVPYGNTFASFPMVKYGYLGVNLFFLISGYVILLTLRKCRSFREFAWRRWLRLFPAIFICSTAIYATAGLVPSRPAGMPELISLAPGLTFTFPAMWAALLHRPVPELEGSFWSLCVEVEFYAIFAAVYFVFGEAKALVALLATALAAIVFLMMPNAGIIHVLNGFQFHQFAWFLCGCLAFRYDSQPSKSNLVFLILSILVLPLNIVLLDPAGLVLVAACFILTAVFLLASRVNLLKHILSNRMLLLFGFASYPLYLLHENLLIGLTIELGRHLPAELAPLIPLPIAAALLGIAIIVATYAEPWLKQRIVDGAQVLRSMLKANAIETQ